MSEIKKTILYDSHVKLGAKMVPFAGYDMPIQYTSIKEEHLAVRENAGMFDVSHMGEIRVKGKDTIKYIDHIFTNDVVNVKNNKVVYGLLCYEDGGVVDDLLVYKISDKEAFLVVNASNIEKDFEWIKKNTTGFDVEVINQSSIYSEIALQGPYAESVLSNFTEENLHDIGFFEFKNLKINNMECIVSRTGYTGEDGFEIYSGDENILKIWDLLYETKEVTPCGLGARDTLRFEVALPLYGHEIDKDITPLEAGLKFAVKLDRNFIGSSVLNKQLEEGLKRKLVGIELLERGIPRNGYEIIANDKVIGHITTGYNSPSVNKSVALALIESEYATLKTEVYVKIRKKLVLAKVRNKKFYKKNYKK